MSDTWEKGSAIKKVSSPQRKIKLNFHSLASTLPIRLMRIGHTASYGS